MRIITRSALGAAVVICALASSATARPVDLGDAGVAPDHVAIIKPGQSVAAVCPDASDVQAYTGTGGALGQQQRTRTGWRWRGVDGFVVLRTDTHMWINRSARPALVASWCGGQTVLGADLGCGMQRVPVVGSWRP